MTEVVKRDIDWGLFFFGCLAMSRGIVYTVPDVRFERPPLALAELPASLFVVYAALWWIAGLVAAVTTVFLRQHHRWAKIGIFTLCAAWSLVYGYSWLKFSDAPSLSGAFVYLFVGLACLLGRGTVQHWVRLNDGGGAE